MEMQNGGRGVCGLGATACVRACLRAFPMWSGPWPGPGPWCVDAWVVVLVALAIQCFFLLSLLFLSSRTTSSSAGIRGASRHLVKATGWPSDN